MQRPLFSEYANERPPTVGQSFREGLLLGSLVLVGAINVGALTDPMDARGEFIFDAVAVPVVILQAKTLNTFLGRPAVRREQY